jgi:C-terminal processing protease CtpA/Prc
MNKKFAIFLLILSNVIYGQIPNKLTNEEKIYGLSKFWQEVNYNFVYINKIDRTEWNSQYKKLISEVQNTPNDYEYYRLLQKFCTFLKDGHTNVWFPKEIQENILVNDFGDYRIFLTNINGKAIITKVNKSKKGEIPIGTEIIKVNGVLTDQHIEQNVAPYISSSTEHILNDWSVQYMLQGYINSTFDLELKLPNGKRKLLKLTHTKSKETELFPEDKTELFEFKWFKKDIAYIALNSFTSWDIMDLFSEKFPDIQKAEKLIIDIRKNGGGDERIGREIIKYLTKDTILYGSKSKSRLHIPYYKATGKYINATDTLSNNWSKQPYLTYHDSYFYDFEYYPYPTSNLDITRIEIPTAILIGHNTGSAAEDFLIYADNQEHMIKIGEPTFGSTGQPMIFDLPNGGTGRVCTKIDTYPDGREFVGYGIKPDIEVKTTLTDYIENKDPVLERAINYLNKK